MTSTTDKLEFLTQHLAYERQMLGVTLYKLQMTRELLEWNAFFESFCVHARNLYDFLRSKADSRNYQANDFVAGHKAPELRLFSRFNTHVFHTGKQRLIDQKINLENAFEACDWIDTQWARWVAALPNDFGRVDPAPVSGPAKAARAAMVFSDTSPPTTTNSAALVVQTITPPHDRDNRS